MSNGRKRGSAAFVTFILALSLMINGCTLFPNNNRSNQPGPVRYQNRKVIPTIPIRPTKIGKAVRVIPTKVGKAVKNLPTQIRNKVKVLPTKVGRELKKLRKVAPIPTRNN